MAESEKINKEAERRNREILQQLKDGTLKGRVKVILILGPTGAGKTSVVKLLTGRDMLVGHKLESGTTDANWFMETIGAQQYLFIDTPGFGHPDLPEKKAKNKIYAMLGSCTRALGGIHGIWYIQSIKDDRTTTGMRESIKFLNELGCDRIRPNVTFITTKWDLVVEKERRYCQSRENEMKTTEWKDFEIGTPNGAGYFHHGVSCEDSEEEKAISRRGLIDGVLSYYQNRDSTALNMPFSEWSFLNQAGTVIEYTVKGGMCVCAAAMVGFAAWVGAPVSFTVTFIFPL